MRALTLEQLGGEVRLGRLEPLYLIFGPEYYLVRQALDLIRRSLAPETAYFNYAEYDVPDHPISAVIESARTMPMMSTRRLVVVSEIGKLDQVGQDMLLSYVRRPCETTTLVLTTAELDRRTVFFKTLAAQCAVFEAQALKGFALERWVEQRAREQGYRLSSSAAKRLIELAGSDLQSLAGEIEKLMVYSGEVKKIPDAAVEELVSASRHQSIFELMKALGRKDQPRALAVLGNLLESGEAPLLILTMTARHFRQVLITKDLLKSGRNISEAGAAAQIPAFLLQEFVRQAESMDEAVARNMFLKLADADLRIKSTRVEERLILEGLIYSL